MIVFLIFFSFTARSEAKFRALLVGIDYQNADSSIPGLRGAVNDVKDIYSLMTDTLGIPKDSIRMLTEEQATREAILSNFREWLINGTKAGDTVFFQFSGHGVQIPDTSGTQPQDPVKKNDPAHKKLAEAFVPFDTQIDPNTKAIKNLIPDSEFHGLLSQIKDRDVTLFLDLCHSGGITRDIANTGAVTRNLKLPWQPEETRVVGSSDIRGFSVRKRSDDATWHPDYAFFAAVKYFQSAYEYPMNHGKNGAFTYPVLSLIKANPQARYTNKEILAYARQFVHQTMGIADNIQEPVFYGPEGSPDKPFVLLAQKSSAMNISPASVQTTISDIGKTGVRVSGEDDERKSQLISSIISSEFAKVEEQHPDVIAEFRSDGVHLCNAAGKRIRLIPISPALISDLMKAIEGIHIVRELAVLENPGAPFVTELWIDEPGKTVFKSEDKITLYYKVNGLPKGKTAYLTLLNVAPDGSVSILYPQKQDFYQGSGEKLFLNAGVETGKTYSIPKSRNELKANVGVDVRIRLAQGQEYFKAVVTSEPIDWQGLDIGEFHSNFRGKAGRSFAEKTIKRTKTCAFWSTASLRAEVNK